MSGEGTAPSYHGRKPQKDDNSGKPAGGTTKAAHYAGANSSSAKSPGKKSNPKPQKRPVHNSTKDKGGY